MNNLKDGSFCLVIDYDKKSPNPENVFIGIAKLLESFQLLDEQLLGCIDTEFTPELLLEDIEKGSLRMWLKNELKRLPDEAICSGDYKKILGSYLVRAKYTILQWCSDKDEITDVETVISLEEQILDVARETKFNRLDCYTKPQRERLLDGISRMSESFESLRSGDIVRLETLEGNVLTINKKFRLPKASIIEFCSGESIENTMEAILKVRRPDFLGESSWVFKHGGQEIKAKILDSVWLDKYLGGNETIVPGDSLRVMLHTISVYDKEQNLINQKNEIVRVITVVPKPKVTEIDLLGSDYN